MFFSGTACLQNHKDWINELNVFPVPDGDTGTNMTLTLMSAVSELKDTDENTSLETVCKKIASGTLKGARGNSGVIMSQLCRGFTKEVETSEFIDKGLMAKAFDRAVKTAYKAVMKPKEGTILTVARACADRAGELVLSDISLDEYFKEIIICAEETLARTPDLLPVLKEAGVVDSGGQGLVEFFRGALEGFRGNVSDPSSDSDAHIYSKRLSIDTRSIETSDIKFGYCTEFIIMAENEFTEKDEDDLRNYLSSLGDSLVLVAMDGVVKVHVHTNHPGLAFEKGLEYGSLTSMKVDNMREEHNEKVIKEADRELAARKESAKKPESLSEYGFISVCAGKGFKEVYKGMSVDEVIEGGQTMNPSTEDFINAIDRIPARNIFILPNNSNVIMAARQAADIYEGKNINVIPSKTVAQGITALFSFLPENSVDKNVSDMIGALSNVKTGEITYAIRDTEIASIGIIDEIPQPMSTNAPKSMTLRTVPVSSIPGFKSLISSTSVRRTGLGRSSRGSLPVITDRKTCRLLGFLEDVLHGHLLDLPVFDVDIDLAVEDVNFDLEFALVGIHH